MYLLFLSMFTTLFVNVYNILNILLNNNYADSLWMH